MPNKRNGTNRVIGRDGLQYVDLHKEPPVPMTSAERWALVFMAVSIVSLVVVSLDVFVWRP